MVKLLLGTKVHKILLQKYEENIKLNLAVKANSNDCFCDFFKALLENFKKLAISFFRFQSTSILFIRNNRQK